MSGRESALRSSCPIANTLDILGDKWSLLIVRDLMFREMSEYGQFLKAGEGISTNILADRIKRLLHEGIIEKEVNPEDRKRIVYTLTQKGIDLMPVLIETILWANAYLPQAAVPPDFMNKLNRAPDKFMKSLEKKLMQTAKKHREK